MPQHESKALDLACGPAHYTLCLHSYLGYRDVTGVDLAANMIKIAQQNARAKNLEGRISFQLGDITDLKQVEDDCFDLSSFTDAAHHMDDLGKVGKILAEMDRVTKPDGLVMLMDLARLRTEALTEKYVNFLGGDYIARGLPNFFNDFRNSMYAAWTYSELQTAIPRDSRRVWCHLVSKVLPTLQIIFGLPVGRQTLFLRKGLPWESQNCAVPEDLRVEWNLARFTLFSAPAKYITSPNSSAVLSSAQM
jgi:ubiquinone/menaquinone biosynthesis C-methylase UbiE